MKFTAYGHANITSRHRNTLEFTKDASLTLNGDCIVGVRADFLLKDINFFLRKLKNKKIKMRIRVMDIIEEIHFEANPDFDDDTEIVIRKSDFKSKRTLGINADKAANDLNLKDMLQKDGQKISVEFFTI
ncbi:MAG: DUF371 domain-containing protein [Nanoarchaeota archaeon]